MARLDVVPVNARAIPLTEDDEMIEQMELDLVTRAQQAFVSTSVAPNVYGVFSLDDLENKTRNELSHKIAIGVGYVGAERTAIETNPKGSVSPGMGNASKMLLFRFVVILAVPAAAECLERYTATKLLTILRRGIFGGDVASDYGQRKWSFEKEAPMLEASTEDMLYYAQTWIVSLPIVGPR